MKENNDREIWIRQKNGKIFLTRLQNMQIGVNLKMKKSILGDKAIKLSITYKSRQLESYLAEDLDVLAY